MLIWKQNNNKISHMKSTIKTIYYMRYIYSFIALLLSLTYIRKYIFPFSFPFVSQKCSNLWLLASSSRSGKEKKIKMIFKNFEIQPATPGVKNTNYIWVCQNIPGIGCNITVFWQFFSCFLHFFIIFFPILVKKCFLPLIPSIFIFLFTLYTQFSILHYHICDISSAIDLFYTFFSSPLHHYWFVFNIHTEIKTQRS